MIILIKSLNENLCLECESNKNRGLNNYSGSCECNTGFK